MNIFPSQLLKAGEKSYILVELKSGESYNGTLQASDKFMNLRLTDVVQTTKDGDRFFKMPEIYIKGNSIKYIRMVDAVMDRAIEEPKKNIKDFARKEKRYQGDKGDKKERRSQSDRGGDRGARRGGRGR